MLVQLQGWDRLYSVEEAILAKQIHGMKLADCLGRESNRAWRENGRVCTMYLDAGVFLSTEVLSI